MLISILVITYNHELYIKKALESLLSQKSCHELEIIVVDDRSKDKTVDIAAGLLEGIANAQIIVNEQNLGITRNYQKGFSLCHGEYVFVLEGDDYWIDSNKIQRQVEFMENHPACVLSFHPYLVQMDDLSHFTAINSESTSGDQFFGVTDLILNEGLIGNFSICCYRNAILQKINPEIYEHLSYDWIVNMAVGQYGLLGKINRQMSVYRHVGTSAWSSKERNEKLQQTLKLVPLYDRLLEGRYAEFFKSKATMLQQEINSDAPQEPGSIKSYLPPGVNWFAKMLVPPAFIKFLRKNNK